MYKEEKIRSAEEGKRNNTYLEEKIGKISKQIVIIHL